MRKIALLSVIVMPIILTSFDKNEMSNGNFNGKIIIVKRETAILNKYSYDSVGNLITDESKYAYIKYNYNIKNQLISIYQYVDEGNLSSDIKVVEAFSKRLIWVNPQNTKTHYTTTFEYNEKGQMVKSINDYGYLLYEYDSNNKIVKEIYYDMEGKKYSYYVDKYDNNGNLICKQEYLFLDKDKDSLVNERKFEFDNKNNPFKGINKSMIPGIDTNKNNIVMTSGKYTFETSYVYNDFGFPIKKDNVEYMYE
jgi:hypothetical protein